MDRIVKLLHDCGADVADIVKVGAWLSDARDFAEFNQAYGSYFSDVPPTRTTVECKLMIDAKVEIDAIAYRPL